MACILRLCAETLPTGSQCKGIALRNQPWCREHSTPERRERVADSSQIIAMIGQMNMATVGCVLQNTVYELRTKVIPPLHAEAILTAANTRLEQLIVEARLAEEQARLILAQAGYSDNPSQNSRLQVCPVK